MTYYPQAFLLCFLVLIIRTEAGTWLSFNSEQGLGDLDGASARRSMGPLIPIGDAGDVNTLNNLLANCQQESLTRATRSDKSKSEMMKLCKTLFERR